MKAYKVTVNGNVYEITIEVVDKADIKASAPAPAPVAVAPASAPSGGQAISAPMPGTILKVNVSNGQAVKKGDVLFVLEAMKMENEIMAPCDGTVAGVSVSAGASVETGTALCSLA
ncbi:MAG: biotin/lipoyl-binding protein [Clostridia bacterium]|nr:biotin/lipoyl-binding protein [Clostridia bacterium]